jgi:6-phosphogluconolactonase
MATENHMAAIGTYSSGDKNGVHTIEVDPETGEMDLLDSIVAGPDPTFVVPHPSGNYIYAAVREDEEGRIATFEIDRETGNLTRINSVPSGSLGPCHCSTDAAGQYLFVAHYVGGTVSMLPIEDNGAVSEPTVVIKHSGSSIDSDRQASPHPHSVNPGPDDEYLFVPDLGTDDLVVYEIQPDEATLSLKHKKAVTPGSGPRHLSFDPTGKRLYLVNELDSTITTFDRGLAGKLTKLSSVPTLPQKNSRNNKAAEVATHPSGDYVFASNRGEDTIATFATEPDGLEFVSQTATSGEWPRHFDIDPLGNHLFVENRHTDDIVAFRIDGDSGKLTSLGERLSIQEPVCLKWIDCN